MFSRDASTETGGYFPRLRAGIVAPLTVRGRCVGTLELYYPRLSSIDMRQTALASGFADLISTQLASFELERQDELTARVELRALQSQVDPHFLFNTISTIVSLVRTEPDKARSLLIDFSNYYRQTLSDSDTLTTLEREAELLSIYVRAFETDDGLEIIVEDDGIGMSEEVCAHLFEQHRREEPESITADGSVKRGCGLALFNVLQRILFLRRRFWYAREVPGGRGNAGHR